MAGIFGYASRRPERQSACHVERMQGSVPTEREPLAYSWTAEDGRVALCVTRGGQDPDILTYARDVISGIVCVLDGFTLPGDSVGRGPDAAGFIEAYARRGPTCVGTVNGRFNVAWWDPSPRTLTICSDRLGGRPLYWSDADGRLVFGSRLDRVMASGLAPLDLEPAAIGDLLAFRELLGDETLFSKVRLLPPGACLSWADGVTRLSRYWRIDEIEHRGRYDAARRRFLAEAFLAAVERSTHGVEAPAIALTGGVDSRCVASAAALLGLRNCFTEGHADSADMAIARRIAQLLELDHERKSIPEERLGEWLEPAARLFGCGIPTLDVHPLHQVFGDPGYDGSIVGTGGENARSYMLASSSLRRPDLAMVRWRVMLQTRSPLSRELNVDELIRPEHASAREAARSARMDAILHACQVQESQLDACDLFHYQERVRRFLIKGPVLGDAGIRACMPYLDHRWVEAIQSLPPSERLRNRIQIDLIRRFAPAVADEPFDKPLASTRFLPELWSTNRRRLQRRWRRRLRLPVRSRPPAFDSLAWSRGPMRDVLRGRILAKGAIAPEYLVFERVEPLVEAHFAGTANHIHLVAALYMLETAQAAWRQTAG